MQPPIPWSRVSVFVTERMAVIHSLKGTVFNLTGELLAIHCLSNSFSRQQQYVYFQKRLVPAMRSFRGTIIISIEYSQISILSKALHIFLTLKFAAIQFCQRTFFLRISGYQSPRKKNKLLIEAAIFSEQHRLYWNESSYFFGKKIFFSEHLVVWSSYFFPTTSWRSIFFQHRHCFGGVTSSE